MGGCLQALFHMHSQSHMPLLAHPSCGKKARALGQAGSWQD